MSKPLAEWEQEAIKKYGTKDVIYIHGYGGIHITDIIPKESPPERITIGKVYNDEDDCENCVFNNIMCDKLDPPFLCGEEGIFKVIEENIMPKTVQVQGEDQSARRIEYDENLLNRINYICKVCYSELSDYYCADCDQYSGCISPERTLYDCTWKKDKERNSLFDMESYSNACMNLLIKESDIESFANLHKTSSLGPTNEWDNNSALFFDNSVIHKKAESFFDLKGPISTDEEVTAQKLIDGSVIYHHPDGTLSTDSDIPEIPRIIIYLTDFIESIVKKITPKITQIKKEMKEIIKFLFFMTDDPFVFVLIAWFFTIEIFLIIFCVAIGIPI